MTEFIHRQDAIRDRDRRANIVFLTVGARAGDFYAPQKGVYVRRGDDTWELIADSRLDYVQMMDAFR